jgi:surfeit locus 1 family protein
MLSVPFFNRRFILNWRMLMLAIFAICFFMGLGFWQIHRAQEKQQILSEQASMLQQKPIKWSPEMVLPKPFQPVEITGVFSKTILLLDNQHNQHQFGYNVISPILLNDHSVVLVDRGWVAGNPSRKEFPEIFVPSLEQTITGTVYFPSAKGILLGEIVEKKEANITIIESLDIPTIRQLLHNKLYPFIIRLDKNEANGFIREWAAVSMPPQRHYAYALQWFSFALVVLILFISLNLKKNDE